MGPMQSWARGCEFFTTSLDLLSNATQKAESGGGWLIISFRIVFAILYWYLWTVAIPRWRGYRLEEEVDVLEDGTSITKLIKVKDD